MTTPKLNLSTKRKLLISNDYFATFQIASTMGVGVMVNESKRRNGRDRNYSSGLLVVPFAWYLFFGALHELSHFVTAWWMGYDFVLLQQHIDDDINVAKKLGHSSTDPCCWVHLAYEVILGRQCTLPNLPRGLEAPVRHAGWIFSCLVLLLLLTVYSRYFKHGFRVKPNKGYEKKKFERPTSFFDDVVSSHMLMAALVTATEAIATDFFGFDQFLPLNVKTTVRQTFYCGNFGVILLNRCWLESKKTQSDALDTLQQMAEVTMMRGAQSGGVVFYQPTTNEEKDENDSCGSAIICSKAVRSRVVNRKRTDLSKLVRCKVEHDLRNNHRVTPNKTGTFVPRMFVGHTRFATSSLSTLDGTHPHQWTPPSPRRVYSMEDDGRTRRSPSSRTMMIPRAAVVSVENYITHNGDFDFYVSHGKTYELETIQNWLSVVTETNTPAPVDSCAIAGMVDILRTRGSFGLSARYALVLGMKSSQCGLNAKLAPDAPQRSNVPPYASFLEGVIGIAFERALEEYCKSFEQTNEPIPTLREIANSKEHRVALQRKSFEELKKLPRESLEILQRAFISNEKDTTSSLLRRPPIVITEDDSSKNMSAHNNKVEKAGDDVESNFIGSDLIGDFCKYTIDAFFDNDLFMTTKIFMQNAKGSFGLSVTSNLDSHRQMCLAARGQTMSIAFYPSKDLVCYGSEQAAVKAGMGAEFPGTSSDDEDFQTRSYHDSNYREVDDESTRLDLDDLGGEIVVLDWGRKKYQTAPVSHPNQHLEEFKLMKGKITAVLYQESKSTKKELLNRMTRLSDNPLIQPLQKSPEDPVLADIRDIPYVCRVIQDDWQSHRASSSLNRLTAFNLSRCLRKRLEHHVNGTVPNMSVDILLTGCEVSLYLAEQFASDLKKAFPKLTIEAVSSNKLLGLYGQEIAVPSVGFQYAPQTRNIHDSIVIIVSHSGGTFGPLACSNLLQSATQNIFVVTSEWDTQIGKQLRMIDEINGHEGNMTHQRIFSTGVGIRPAEPCSVSVAATHQLLTNLFKYMSVIVLSDPRFRRATKAQINEQDIQILERCSQMNINALTDIVGYNMFGYELDQKSSLLNNLHKLGNLWADHILEQTRAYIMSFFYIFITVTSGWPLICAIGRGFGVADEHKITYLFRFLDSCIFFWLPQICITIIRIYQGRNLRHRMVGRTVVIGDIPWVSQCADAFLSKCFAVSYSIAGLNVLSGNPSDHFVHRHTHRVVRGTLAIFGRPDGRLSALSTAEGSVCLSVNQASSIQSWGGTCESVTIGHNPFRLNLAKTGLFLKRHRPLFLCERLLVETDADEEKANRENGLFDDDAGLSNRRGGLASCCKTLSSCFSRSSHDYSLSESHHRMMDCSINLKIRKQRSSHALVGAYLDINNQKKSESLTNSSRNEEKDNDDLHGIEHTHTVDDIVADAIQDRQSDNRLHLLYEKFDNDGDGILSEKEFVTGLTTLVPELTEAEAEAMFRGADKTQTGMVDYNEFLTFLKMMGYDQQVSIPPSNRDKRGLIQIEASKERYFGETLRKYNAGKNKVQDMDMVLAQSQHLVQELYESRVASMQRFVAMCVLFHHMSKRVERFFAKISFGYWAYRMDRTHSIVRIATTASPVSGSDVRQRIERLRLWKKVIHSVHTIEVWYLEQRKRKNGKDKVSSKTE